ncbi:helix-turn-helix transcriptional regulator [Paenibacillus illinoisensis]|uniref:AraC family transcriptional regulator n=1 Tax=Paenibacillus illinoisensis TaxID=59845 RepID=UPI003D285395
MNKPKDTFYIEPLKYKPPKSYTYDLEIFSFSELKERTPEGKMYIPYRYEFYMLVCVTEGECKQWIDFQPITCKAGTLLVVSPNQVHNFGHDENWEGWIILFRSEFLIPDTSTINEQKLALDIERLPKISNLTASELSRVVELIQRMAEDATIEGMEEDVIMLLRYQLYTCMIWLNMLNKHKQDQNHTSSLISQRFTNFQKLLEKHFFEWNHVNDYASVLQCTEKTLSRATMESAGISAKAYITARILLEAKRLLVHTDQTISEISNKLNFKEATHFSKFFKRETGCTPSEFRQGEQ